jgi:hypothetical protein
MSVIDLEGWIDSVHAELDSRMSNRYPAASESVSIPYTHQASSARATGVPRVEWSQTPKYAATYEITRQNRTAGAIGTAVVTLEVNCVAANLDDCRALVANLLQAMLQISSPPKLRWPIKAQQAARDTSHDGRLSQRIELLIGVEFPVPEDPQDIGTWEPTAPSIEETVDKFDTTVAEDQFDQT